MMHPATDGGEGPDEAVHDGRARPDDGRAPDAAAHHPGPGLDHDPPVELGLGVDLAVDAPLQGLEDQPVGLQQRGQLARVDPPAVEDLGADPQALVDQPLDGVGDLQLAASGRADGRHRLVDPLVEEVHADQGQVGRRWVGLLDQPDDRAVGVQLGHPEPLRVGDRLEQDLGAREPLRSPAPRVGAMARSRSASNRSTKSLSALLEQVVAEVHHEVVRTQEVPGDQHGVGQAQRLRLGEVGDLEAPGRTVADRGPHLRRGVADDDADLLDAGVGDGLEAVEEDRLVGHRHQLLGPGVGDGPQPGAGPACEYERLHPDGR